MGFDNQSHFIQMYFWKWNILLEMLSYTLRFKKECIQKAEFLIKKKFSIRFN